MSKVSQAVGDAPPHTEFQESVVKLGRRLEELRSCPPHGRVNDSQHV